MNSETGVAGQAEAVEPANGINILGTKAVVGLTGNVQGQFDADLQEPFQPGSTPVHYKSRFMVWNSVGIVKGVTDDSGGSIEVEFHDAAVHHPIHLGNSNQYIMADLSEECVLLASDCDDYDEDDDTDPKNPSMLHCHNFASSDPGSREWTFSMPDGEAIMAITCGNGWVRSTSSNSALSWYLEFFLYL